jgi:hypothetical protein
VYVHVHEDDVAAQDISPRHIDVIGIEIASRIPFSEFSFPVARCQFSLAHPPPRESLLRPSTSAKVIA